VGIIYGAGISGAVPRHCDCERLVEDGTGRRRRDGREATAAVAASERAGDVVVGVKGCAWVSEGAGDHSRTAVLDLNRTAYIALTYRNLNRYEYRCAKRPGNDDHIPRNRLEYNRGGVVCSLFLVSPQSIF
jgi:hypothetical protein